MKRLIVRQGLLLLIPAILTGSAGWYAHKWYVRYYEDHAQRRVVSKGYEFTSPLLDVELPEGFNINHEPHPFKYKIAAYIKKKIEGGQVGNIAVYYRDLHDGPWFGINSKIEFNPASIMKVPVMIAWLKRAEDIQLHEFGIVYHAKSHYILGVMTRGRDFAAQAEVIRDISRMIYSEIDSSIAH